MNYFDSDMPNSTKTVVYCHGKDDNLYIYICGQGHKQFIRCRSGTTSIMHLQSQIFKKSLEATKNPKGEHTRRIEPVIVIKT
jgi:hypothetical protein